MSNPDSNNIPYGFCHCGCGQKTNLSSRTDTAKGRIKGQPFRFISQHHNFNLEPKYVIEHRGYGTPCWIWQWFTNSEGYGVWQTDGEQKAHRVYYKRANGSIPKGLQIDHLCRQKNCVNPQHLEAVTLATNVRRGNSTKLTPENVAEIRNLYASSHLTYPLLGKMFGVSEDAIGKAIRRKNWHAQ